MAKKVALLIGVSDYGEGIPSLSAPLNDVKAMKGVLENREMGGFEKVKILENPNLENTRIAVEQIFKGCGKEDLVLLYFSGHGITDDYNRLYLTTKGTSKDYYKSTSVPASFVQDISQECYAKRQVIILDCCYSGAFAEGWQAKSVGLDIQKELGAEGRVVLTSSTATQTSFQQEGEELSLYTKYFIEGIETGAADKDGDGKIHVHELHDYTKAKVQDVKPKQKPEIILDKEGYKIILSQAPINDPELDFRKLVEKKSANGTITIPGRYFLDNKRQKLGITKEKSEEIINEVLAPYRKRLENIEHYRKVYQETVDHHYPLTKQELNDLNDFQDVLGLEDEDIAEIQAEIETKKENQSNKEKSENLETKTQKNLNQVEEEKEDELISGPGVDFTKLRDFLATGKWRKADEETTRLMLQLGDKDEKGYLNTDDCRNFPREELRTIDRLWLDNSEGKFGFSVQKRIYLEEGGKLDDYDYDSYERMSDRIGWYKNNEWLSYSKLIFDNTTAPQGHLPGVFRGLCSGGVALLACGGGISLFSSLDSNT